MRARTNWGRVAWWVDSWGLTLVVAVGVLAFGVAALVWWTAPPRDGVFLFAAAFAAWAGFGLALVLLEAVCWRMARRYYRRN